MRITEPFALVGADPGFVVAFGWSSDSVPAGTITTSVESHVRVVMRVVSAGAWVGVLLVGGVVAAGVGATLIVNKPVVKKAPGWVALVIVSSAAAFERVTVPTVSQSACVRAHVSPGLHEDVSAGSSLDKISSKVTGV